MIRVSASAFDILWSDVVTDAAPRPGVLRIPSGGATDTERRRIREDVYANLADRGLLPGGRVDEVLCARLEALASAPVTIECEFLFDVAADEEPLRAVLAGSRTGPGVLAVQPERTIGVAAVGEGRLFADAAGVLPDVEPGPGAGVNLPSDALSAADDPVFDGRAFDGTAGSRAYEQQVREALAIQARPVLAAGQFTLTRRTAGEPPRRLGGATWFLTDVGAYTGVTHRGGDGRSWTSVAPADRDRVAARLADLADAEDGAPVRR